MSVHLAEDGTIELVGRCGVEDAEGLQGYLLAGRKSPVEWSGCEHLHSAVLQVLLVAEPSMRGEPRSAFLRAHVAPLLRSVTG